MKQTMDVSDATLAMIEATKTGDEAALVAARQMVPLSGAGVAPYVTPLLSHEKESVWRTAYNILADVANEACAPGREDDREYVNGVLMSLLDESPTPHVIEWTFRLLPLVTPEGADVDAVAAYLDQPDYREKARTTLEAIGTVRAAAALKQATRGADSAFAAALAVSLGRTHRDENRRILQHTIKHEDAGVRAAAALALARTGYPGYAKSIAKAMGDATPETLFDTTDALLKLADAMKAKGHVDQARAAYQTVLDTTTYAVLKDAARIGLG